MQSISNLLLNLILLYPLILVSEYFVGESRKLQLKKLINVAGYLFLVNLIFIDIGVYCEGLLYLYVLVLIPAGIIFSMILAKMNSINIALFSSTHIIGIKRLRVFTIFLGYIVLFVLISIVNYQTDSFVLETNNNILETIRMSENPVEELIYLSETPRTLISKLDKLIEINENDFEVLHSGNYKKYIRGIVNIDNVIYSYELTYRRIQKRWVLDGIYNYQETHY